MVRHIQLLIVMTCSISPLLSQSVEFPDTRFLYALIEEGVDTNGDSAISYAEAGVIDALNISNKGIHDLTGIEAFTNLVELNCSQNYLTTLNVSENSSLERLHCWTNRLTDLDVCSNTSITELRCDFNKLSTLDVSNNGALYLLSCEVNPLKYLDVSYNANLKILGCLDTQIEILDLSNNALLEFLRCNFNPLSNLDVSNNKALRYLECMGIGLNTLDISNNRELAYLGCSFNQLTNLDVSNIDSLQKLYCGYNPLNTLDISNNITLKEINVSGMPGLTEICVWTVPFPLQGVEVYATGSPNIYFKDCKAPEITISDTQQNPDFIEVTSSEDGMIYLVPDDTECEMETICGICFDSVRAVAHSPVVIPLSGIENGNYWLYARDSFCNLSYPLEFSLMGAGVDPLLTGHINIYPNPFNDIITIQTGKTDRYSIGIRSMNNQLVYSTLMEGNSFKIDLTPVLKGIYLITIKSNDLVSTEKIIKL